MTTGDGSIEKRDVLLDGSLPAGERDALQPRKTMYFAQLDKPHFAVCGPLRASADEAIEDGRRYTRKIGVYVPCFETPMSDEETERFIADLESRM